MKCDSDMGFSEYKNYACIFFEFFSFFIRVKKFFTEYNYLIYRLSIIIEYKKMTAEAVI